MKQINIVNKCIVLKDVQTSIAQDCHNYVKVKSVKLLDEKEDVYNMEVEKYHNFSINNGLIVHNCIDPCRYALEDEFFVKEGAEVRQGTRMAGLPSFKF